jgi:hypothetical protein
MLRENSRSTGCPPIVFRHLMFSPTTPVKCPLQRLPPLLLLQFPGMMRRRAASTRMQVLRIQGLLKRWL